MRDGTEKFPTPDSHVDGENGAKTMVYNTKKNSKRGTREENKKKKERLKKYNNKKKELSFIDTFGCFYIHIQEFSFSNN